ncbi:MAG: DUF3592 domain-containing protein [bacterium]|nr:DUF3592 domain-containing protein [bacterium]
MYDPNLFLLNPANRPFVTGEKTRIGSTRGMMILALILLIVAGGMAGYIGVQVWNHQQLETASKAATARVIDGYSSTSSRGGGTTYHLTYTYRIESTDYTAEHEVNRNFYDSVFINDRVAIRYLPGNPSVSVIEGQGLNLPERADGLVVPGVFAIAALIGALFCVIIDGNNRRFSNNGQFLDGTVIEAKNTNAGRGNRTLTVKFRFMNPTGTWIEKKTSTLRSDIGTWSPPPGTPVKVRYVNDRSFRLM